MTNMHVRGFIEEGTTTTPFDMVVLNRLDRFHLAMDVIERVPGLGSKAAHVKQHFQHGLEGSVIFNPEYDDLYFWDVAGKQEGPIESSLAFPFTDTPDPREFPEERHRLALTDILEAIEDGREPLVPGSEALKSLAIVLAIEESARTGCETAVQDVEAAGA